MMTVKRESARSKTRILHWSFLLPFFGLPTYGEDAQLEPVVSPETVEEVIESVLSMLIWICCEIRTRRQSMMEVFWTTVIALHLKR